MSYLKGLPEQTDLWDVIRAREDLWKFTIPAVSYTHLTLPTTPYV